MDIVLDRVTHISFPNVPGYQDITKGIASGSLNLKEILCEGNPRFGFPCANKFEVELYGIEDIKGEYINVIQTVGSPDTVIDQNGDEILDQYGKPIYTGGVESIFCGYVDECKSDDAGYYRSIVAYDAIYRYGSVNVANWWNTFWKMNKNSTLRTLRISLCKYVGIESSNKSLINDDVIFSSSLIIPEISFVNMLSFICELSAIIPNINREGLLDYVEIETSTSQANDITNLYETDSSQFEDYIVDKITGINIIDESDNIRLAIGSADNAYTLSNNILLFDKSFEEIQTILTPVFEKIHNISYTPSDINMIISNPSYNLGSMVKTSKGYSPILINELSGPLFIEQTLSCKGDKNLKETSGTYNSSYTRTLNKLAEIKYDIDGLSAKFGEYSTTAQMESAISQTAQNIELVVSQTYTTQKNFDDKVESLQGQIDGNITTYTGDDVPTLSNYPVNTWKLEEYANHIGDLYFVNDQEDVSESGFRYRFQQTEDLSSYEWVLIKDSDVTKALGEISDLEKRVSSAELKITDDAITTTVTSSNAWSTLSTKVQQTAEGLESKVEKDGVISAINQSAEEVSIEASKINLNGAITANGNTKINKDGTLEAVDGKFSGIVDASTLSAKDKVQINNYTSQGIVKQFAELSYLLKQLVEVAREIDWNDDGTFAIQSGVEVMDILSLTEKGKLALLKVAGLQGNTYGDNTNYTRANIGTAYIEDIYTNDVNLPGGSLLKRLEYLEQHAILSE